MAELLQKQFDRLKTENAELREFAECIMQLEYWEPDPLDDTKMRCQWCHSNPPGHRDSGCLFEQIKNWLVTHKKEPDKKEKKWMTIETAREIAARIWCDPEFDHLEMNVYAAEAIANILLAEAKAQEYVIDAELERRACELNGDN